MAELEARARAGASRPLSPHLQIYKPMLTMMMSIAHRITGAALYFGMLLLAWWLIAAASGANAYAGFETFMGSLIGRLILFGYTWALLHHLLGGIRHLIWDTLHGFEPAEREMLAARHADRLDRADHRAVGRRLSGHRRPAMSAPRRIATPMRRVRGLGAARTGTSHFWLQRVTSVAGIPLTIAFIVIVIALIGRSHAAVAQILGSPLVAIIMLLFILNTAYHMWIGMQEIILDYVHEDTLKMLSLMANTFFVVRRGARLAPSPSSSFRSESEAWRATDKPMAARRR